MQATPARRLAAEFLGTLLLPAGAVAAAAVMGWLLQKPARK